MSECAACEYRSAIAIRSAGDCGLSEDAVLAITGLGGHLPGHRHLRITVFGDHCYAALIEARELDWRVDVTVPFNVLESADLEVVASSSEVIRDPAGHRTSSRRSAAKSRSLLRVHHPNSGPYRARPYLWGLHDETRAGGARSRSRSSHRQDIAGIELRATRERRRVRLPAR